MNRRLPSTSAIKPVVADRSEKSETFPTRNARPFQRKKTFAIVVAFFALQSILRLAFFYIGTYGGAQLITAPPGAFVMNFINAFSLALGVAGLLVIPGLVFSRNWGYWGTVGVSVLTVGFDLWAFFTAAQTAAVGLVVPLIMLAYILPKYKSFLQQYRN